MIFGFQKKKCSGFRFVPCCAWLDVLKSYLELWVSKRSFLMTTISAFTCERSIPHLNLSVTLPASALVMVFYSGYLGVSIVCTAHLLLEFLFNSWLIKVLFPYYPNLHPRSRSNFARRLTAERHSVPYAWRIRSSGSKATCHMANNGLGQCSLLGMMEQSNP